MSEMNRIYNARNPFQGEYPKVLFVCSAGLLRSPTAAHVFSRDPWNFNTRAAGAEPSFALIPVDRALLEWADVVVCMTPEHHRAIEGLLGPAFGKPVHVWDIPDNFRYRDPALVGELVEAGMRTWGAIK